MESRPSVIMMEDIEQATRNAVSSALDERGEAVISTSFAIWPNEPILMGMYQA